MYDDLVMESTEITEKHLEDMDYDPSKKRRSLRLLKNFLICLAKLQIVGSMESYLQQKNKQKKPKTTEPTQKEVTTSDDFPRPQTPYSEPRFPTSFETPQTNKRNISETSFGSRSTESTPKKLIQAEAKVQSLQNAFVNDIINTLWDGWVKLYWVKGRRMRLQYAEYNPLQY